MGITISEMASMIESAEEVWADIMKSGRHPHNTQVNREALDAYGGSHWRPGKTQDIEPSM